MGEETAAAWPTGTVTFVITDIERSTSLYQTLGSAYEALQDEHRALCRASFDAHGGVEVSCPGDGFMVAFDSPSAAVAAAVDVQRRNTAHVWPEGAELRTRIGVHTGEATLTSTGGTYAGLSLHEVERVASAGHGGQVLVSESTFRLVEDHLPNGVTARTLGAHGLSGIDAPRTLFELQGAGLPSGFPPLRTQTERPGNLPTRGRELIGREGEIASLAALVPAQPLTTLVGLGGIGKTSLALAVARTLEARYDGAWFVDLAAAPTACPVSDLTSRAARALDLDITVGPRALGGALRHREVLIVLDNCEHLVESVAEIAEVVLEVAPRVRLLATSRERLGLPGERVVALHALPAPASTELFRIRAADVAAGFEMTPSVRVDVERICERLDHLPLAIELAARRVNVLSPADILDRLDHRFALLTGGGGRRTADRHRTLEATIDWSFSLLSEREQRLLSRLSVFAGGCTLVAAQSVCGGDPLAKGEVLDLVAALVDRSLVTVDRDDAGVRYRLLETVRAFAADRLEASDEATDLRTRHLRWYADLSWGAVDLLFSGGGSIDLAQLARDSSNMWAAVGWAQRGGDLDMGLRVASGVALYGFEVGGHFRVSRTWVEELLAAGAASADPSLRVHALQCAANVASATEDDVVLSRYGEEMLTLVDRHDLPAALRGCALVTLAFSQREHEPRRLAGLREGAELQEQGGALGLSSFTQSMISQFALEAGDLEAALLAAERALQLGRRTGLDMAVSRALAQLARVAVSEGDVDVATERAAEALAVARSAGARTEEGLALIAQAVVAAAAGDLTRSGELFVEATTLFTGLGFASLPVRIYATIATQQIRAADRLVATWAIDQLAEALASPPTDPASRRALATLVAAAEEANMADLIVSVRDRIPPEEAG